MSKKLLKIVIQEWKNASRDERELSAAKEAGFSISVMAKGGAGDKFRKDSVAGFDVYRFSTRPLGSNKYFSNLNRVVSVFKWAHYVKTFRADVISGHDFIALFIGYLSCWYKPKNRRPKLIYDSHEFELARSLGRSKLMLFWIKHLERFLIKQCVFVIMINDSIADEVSEIHKLKTRPIVIRNTPNLWNLDEGVCEEIHRRWLEQMGMNQNTFIIMYHGYIAQNRGLEIIINVLTRTESILLVIVGDAQEPEYREKILQMAKELAVSDRMLVLPAVPLDELWKYVGAADAGLVIHPAATRNYYYVLPNKFFENIQAETPLICSDLPELARLVKKYDIGLLVDPDNAESIRSAIEKLRNNKEIYRRFKGNLKIAKTELCWEKERRTLIDAYSKLISRD